MRIDHIVWYCADLDQGRRFFSTCMDAAPVYGGIHPGEGTRNALVSLGDQTYVEILGRDPEQPESSLEGEVRQLRGAGIYHWAAGDADLEDLRARAAEAGLDGSDLATGGRTLPNGGWLGWRWFCLKNHGFGSLVPFFIDWMDSAHPGKTAPRGGRVVGVEAFTPDPVRLESIYRVLGLEIPVTQSASSGLAVTIASNRGQQTLRMFDPTPRGYVI
jgi:hypothetical protein